MTHQEKVKDIKEHPEKHKHKNLNELASCCFINDAIDMHLVELHEGSYGSNGGVRCDVSEGPCSCGAWHQNVRSIK